MDTAKPFHAPSACPRTEIACPKDSCVHQLFEAQVEQSPDAIAVVFQDQKLTYQELNRRANQLAHELRERGVGPEIPVGLCVERSLHMPVGVLGVLKAGGAYVPLDAAYPDDRLSFMLADTDCPVLLTQNHLKERLPKTQAQLVCLDTEWASVDKKAPTDPICLGKAENLAYIIYTSGSTGKPKGVAMEHRPLVNLICWQIQNSSLPPQARTLQFAPLSFDVSFQEMFSTWCAGGTLVLIVEELRRDPMRLVHYLTQQRVQRIFVPFVALQQLAEASSQGSQDLLQDLREVVTAGEQLKITRTIARFFEERRDCTLENQYGPTESHVVTAFTLRGSPRGWMTLPPIGRPIANTEIYLLNARLEAVAFGEPGELYIGGDCLARGYWKRPELTAERFIPHPFSDRSGARLYRSGDLARWLPDAKLEFLGRADRQVKIRGFRVELGEIESVMSQHPAVQEAAVIRREDVPGEARLVAYLVVAKDPAPSVTELRRFVRKRLPEYMVPSAIVTLQSLPLTPSGKVDRQLLPAPAQQRPALEQPFVEPRNELEHRLQGIVEEVLGIRPVGVRDAFSELGADSLQVTNLLLLVEKLIGKSFPSWPSLQEASIEELAELLQRPNRGVARSALVELQPRGVKPPLFLVHGIGGEVASYLPLAHCLSPDQPVYGFHQLQPPPKDPESLPLSVAAMAAAYLQELLAIQSQEFLLGGYSFGAIVAFEMAQQLAAKGKKVALLAVIDEFDPDPGRRASWTVRRVAGFLHNIPFWLRYELLPGSLPEHYARLARAVRRFKHKLAKHQGRSPGQALEEDVADLFPVARLPESFRLICEANYRALMDYRPQPYPGRITLFKARSQPLVCRHGADLGWGRLAAGGLTTRIIPGTHDSILKEPYVKVLAEEFKAAIALQPAMQESRSSARW